MTLTSRCSGPYARDARTPTAERASWAEKKGVPSDTPPALRAVSRMWRLFQCVNAGAEVNVKCRTIHHQRRY